MIGSTMENLVRWTIVGRELAALAAITGGFVWSVAKSIVVYVHGMADESYASFRRGTGPQHVDRAYSASSPLQERPRRKLNVLAPSEA